VGLSAWGDRFLWGKARNVSLFFRRFSRQVSLETASSPGRMLSTHSERKVSSKKKTFPILAAGTTFFKKGGSFSGGRITRRVLSGWAHSTKARGRREISDGGQKNARKIDDYWSLGRGRVDRKLRQGPLPNVLWRVAARERDLEASRLKASGGAFTKLVRKKIRILRIPKSSVGRENL